MSKGKSSNVKKKNNTTTQKAKKEKTISQELMADEANYTFLRIIIAVILIAIIVILAVKACKKDEEEPDKKDKKVTTTQKKVEVTTTTPYVYYYEKAKPVSDTKEDVSEVVNVASTVADEKEDIEDEDDLAPSILNVDNNGVYESVNITAFDDKTSKEDLVTLIDGESYNLDTDYNKNGKHTVTVIDEAGNESEVTFIIAKIVTTKGEYEEALEDQEIEYIAFANDINDDIEVTRDVTLTSIDGVTLTFGITVKENVNAALENVDVKQSNGKKIIVKGNLKIDSSEVEFDSNAIVLENDESTLEVVDSDINLSEEHGENPIAIVIGSGVKSTDIKLERSNINLGDNTSRGIVYENENDDSSLSIVNSTITGSDEENPAVGISLSNQQNSTIEISSSEITGFDPSINLSDDVTNCEVNVKDSELSGDPSIVGNTENNQITIEPAEEESEYELLSSILLFKAPTSIDEIKDLEVDDNNIIEEEIIIDDKKTDEEEETKEEDEELESLDQQKNEEEELTDSNM